MAVEEPGAGVVRAAESTEISSAHADIERDRARVGKR